MDITKRVCLNPDYILERIDNEITVYHPSLTTSLYLNESGALIWELCDGNRRITDIIEIIKAGYPEEHKQIDKDVIMIIGQLADHKIVELLD